MIAAVLVCSRRGSCSSDSSCRVLGAVFCLSRVLVHVISRAEYFQLLLANNAPCGRIGSSSLLARFSFRRHFGYRLAAS
jgi:hypothetical protein